MRLRDHSRKDERLRYLIELSGYAIVRLFAALSLMGADRVVVVPCGQDLDAMVNSDDTTIAATFQLERPCTYGNELGQQPTTAGLQQKARSITVSPQSAHKLSAAVAEGRRTQWRPQLPNGQEGDQK